MQSVYKRQRGFTLDCYEAGKYGVVHIVYVVGCSVNGLDYYYPCQRAQLFGKVGSMTVFESRGRRFDSRPGQFFLWSIGSRNGGISQCQGYGVVLEKGIWFGLGWFQNSLQRKMSSVVGCSVNGLDYYYPDAEEKLPRPGIESMTSWLKDRPATNFAKDLSPLARIVIIQAIHRTPYYIYDTGLFESRIFYTCGFNPHKSAFSCWKRTL